MAGVDAGERVPCPSCGLTVLQKTMIPVLDDGSTGMAYRCVDCARKLIVEVVDAEPGGLEADQDAEATDAAETTPADTADT